VTEIDLSKNGVELVNQTVLRSLGGILTACDGKNLEFLSLRDNLIRDEAADAINVALK
jgi:hypothetical protein